MLLEKLENKRNFTPTDTAIADYLLNHPAFSSTSTDLGKSAGASQAAVIRLIHKCGYESYQQFIVIFSSESRERLKNTAVRLEEPFTAKLNAAEAEENLHRIYSEVIDKADAVIDRHLLQRLINRMKTSHMIDIYGNGISGLYAQQLSFDLMSLRLPCRFVTGLNPHYLEHADKTHTMAVLYSFTGENRTMIELADTLHAHHIWTAGLIGRPDTSLCTLVDLALNFSLDYYHILDNLSFETAAAYLNHLIYSLLVSEKI